MSRWPIPLVIFGLALACGGRARSLPDASTDAGSEADAGETDGGEIVPDAGRERLHILFIGDSYTFVNDLPGMLERIAATAETGPLIATEEVVQGGAQLMDLWNTGIPQARISDGGWTHVVLQGQSVEPLSVIGDPADFTAYAQLLGDLVVDAGARPVLFVTWARAAADNDFYGYWIDVGGGLRPPMFVSPAEMQDELTIAYADVSRGWSSSILGCAGEAFERSLRAHPEIVLQQSDHSHATVAGTYLAACTFYVALTGLPVPRSSEVPAGLSTEDAAVLRDIALVGSDCANVRLQGLVTLTDRNGWYDEVDAGIPFDYGTAGMTITSAFYLVNRGQTDVSLSDLTTLSPSFAWTSGAYPGGAGRQVGLDGASYPYCGTTLPAQSTCALSIDYTGAAEDSAVIALSLEHAYTSSAFMILHGTSTSRALLVVSSSPDLFSCGTAECGDHLHVPSSLLIAMPGQTTPVPVFVTNRGGAPTTAIAEGAPLLAPFAWAGSGTFPGGSDAGTIEGVSYNYCSGGVLEVGQQCLIAPSFSPLTFSGYFIGTIDIAYSDATGPVLPDATWGLIGESTDDGGHTK